MSKNRKSDIVVIKKYSNRRLYNTSISNYITLEDLFVMVKENVNFVVKDAKNDEDITRSVLTQVIFEQEAKGYSILPVEFLKQIIRFYGDNVATILPTYLDLAMKSFADNHEKMSEKATDNKDFNPVEFFEEATKKNIEFFTNAMNVFYKKD